MLNQETMVILLIVQPDRADNYEYLRNDSENEYVLLWYEKKPLSPLPVEQYPIRFSKIIYWADFTTPQQIINRIKPDKIVFFEIIDLRQIALIVCARANNISTFYLEHGAAGDKNTAISRWNELTIKEYKIPYLIDRFRRNFGSMVKSKLFYYSVFKGFSSLKSYLKYLALPVKMLSGLPNKILSQTHFRERVPKYSIVFNRINWEQYALYTGIEEKDALLTGVPFFDKFYRPELDIVNHVVFIDHPYLEEKMLNWTPEYHKKLADTLFSFAKKRQIKVYIKLHPRSDLSRWKSYSFDPDYVEILQMGDYTELYLKSKLILGYSSSLINGFLCARKNVVLVGWHPVAQIQGMDFSKTGLCYCSLSLSDLDQKFEYWSENNLSLKNAVAYEAFLKDCNYPFDGNAEKRVIEAINNL